MRSRNRNPAARGMFVFLMALAASIWGAGGAYAQDGQCGDDPDCLLALGPAVVVTPGSLSLAGGTADTLIAVAVQWCASVPLDTASITYVLNRVPSPGGNFTVGTDPLFVEGRRCYYHGTSQHSVRLQPGANDFSASIWDEWGRGGSAQATYAYSYNPPPPPPGSVLRSVQVTPDAGSAQAIVGRATVPFRVTNTGNALDTVTLSVQCQAPTGGCATSHERVVLQPGHWTDVAVTSTPSATGTGRMRLLARTSGNIASDSGWVNVEVVAAGSTGLHGDGGEVVGLHRSLCLAVGLGAGAASECGDLRLVHALPTTTVLNEPRTPVMIYNSDHARPTPILYRYFNPDAALGTPASVVLSATLLDWGGYNVPVTAATTTFTGWAPGASATRRLAVSFDASTLATGVYRYVLRATANYAGGATQVYEDPVREVVIVNRSDSRFGAGWWLAGLEQLLQVGPTGTSNRIMTVGGDGSVRVFTATPGQSGQWTAPNPTGEPDTLVLTTVPGLSGGSVQAYVRKLPGGAGTVQYDLEGRHFRTENALDQRTEFVYRTAGLSAPLDSIRLPETLSGRMRYGFGYSANGSLTQVVAPANGAVQRVVRVVTDASRRITAIVDPREPGRSDSTFVAFGYGTTARVSSRTDRMGRRRNFGYDAGKVNSTRLVMGTGEDIVTVFSAVAQTRGLTGGGIASGSIYTRIDGPLNDSIADLTTFYLDRYGAPTRIVDAYGKSTYAYREDARFPGLVTRTQSPSGRIMTAAYDARGNLIAQTDWSTYSTDAAGRLHYATTTYEHHPRYRLPIRVTLPEGETSFTGYDEYGRVSWSQQGHDRLRRDSIVYFSPTHGAARGQPERIITPLTTSDAQQVFQYDGLGNLTTVSSRDRGTSVVTEYVRDAIGRATEVRSPNGTRTVSDMDVMDRVTRTTTTSEVVSFYDHTLTSRVAPAQSLVVANYLNREGQPDSVSRWSNPDDAGVDTITTRWRYDAAGRVVQEIAPDGTPDAGDNPRDSTIYNAAGQVTDHRSRRGLWTRMRYDGVGRMVRRITDPVTISTANLRLDLSPLDASETSWDDVIAELQHDTSAALRSQWTFPLYGQDAEGNFTRSNANWDSRQVVIRGDTAVFTYDANTGAMTGAFNRDAVVRREYNPNGTLLAETQRIRDYAGTDTTKHSYRLEYRYDRNGRRTQVIHPSLFRDGGTQRTTSYAYEPGTGALSTINTSAYPQGLGLGTIRYTYNVAGQVDSLVRGPSSERFLYDGHGRLLRRIEHRGGVKVHDDSLSYAPLTGKLVGVRAQQGSGRMVYSGMGALAFSDDSSWTGRGSRRTEHYETDALANQVASVTAGTSLRQIQSFAEGAAWAHGYEAGTGRLLWAGHPDAAGASSQVLFDQAGNTVWRFAALGSATPYKLTAPASSRWGLAQEVPNAPALTTEGTAFFYGADERLRVVDRRGCLSFISRFERRACEQQGYDPVYEKRSAFEEYRYDALGRRVLVRTRQTFACTVRCLEQLRRTVYDGDQVLYEIAALGGDTASAATMERDTGRVSRFGRCHEDEEGLEACSYQRQNGLFDFFQTGRVMYLHGQGIDQPLAILREEYSDSIPGGWYVPSANWRGTYDGGWTPRDANQCYKRYFTRRVTDDVGWDGSYTGNGDDEIPNHSEGEFTLCADVDWPAQYTWAYRQYRRGYNGPFNWMGSLIYESRDASGLHYRRNRFYDAEAGRFTQEDPIGMAGGINVYGFANGDPVGYSDPYGLAADTIGKGGGGVLAAAAVIAVAEPTPVGEALLVGGAVGVGVATAANKWNERVWVTYTLTNSAGQVYSGRTSGWGDPQALVERRFARHHMRLQGFGNPQVDLWASGLGAEDAIRGREQQLIDAHGGARSDGGTSGNAIRGVSKWNPFGRIYHAAAIAKFGHALNEYTGKF